MTLSEASSSQPMPQHTERPPSCREWLRANGYGHVADLIDEVMSDWRATGRRTRRNWWIVLAGNRRGLGRVVAGRVFPVIPEARARSASGLSGSTSVPPVRVSNRWPPA